MTVLALPLKFNLRLRVVQGQSFHVHQE